MNEEEFEKQQLEQLISDLKDIDKYTSFKNGAFIYDLGKYQGSLLINHINNLQSKIDKAIELKHNWQNIKENATMVFDNNSLIEFMNNLENILKEDE